MWHNSVSLDLSVPPEKIYAYLADFTRHAEWSSNVRRIELIKGKVGQVGAEYKASEDTPRDLTSFARITELTPPLRIRWESTDHKVFRTEWTFDIAPLPQGASLPQGATLTQSVKFHPLSFFANIILYLFRVPVVEKEDRLSLERIKTNLEK